MESFGDAKRRELMAQSRNIFRVLIKTLLKAGIITERTRPLYAAWVDMDELAAEDDQSVREPIAEEGMAYLRDINRSLISPGLGYLVVAGACGRPPGGSR